VCSQATPQEIQPELQHQPGVPCQLVQKQVRALVCTRQHPLSWSPGNWTVRNLPTVCSTELSLPHPALNSRPLRGSDDGFYWLSDSTQKSSWPLRRRESRALLTWQSVARERCVAKVSSVQVSCCQSVSHHLAPRIYQQVPSFVCGCQCSARVRLLLAYASVIPPDDNLRGFLYCLTSSHAACGTVKVPHM
jgi:hypothetical protein